MNEWIIEWWKSNAAPLWDALLTLDAYKMLQALYNAPSAYIGYVVRMFHRNPEHVIIETFLIGFILYVMLVKRAYDPVKNFENLTEAEIDKLCEEWEPEPLVEKPKKKTQKGPYAIVTTTPSTTIKIEGSDKPILNFGMFGFLGLENSPQVKEKAKEALLKYGCGSCGPRGFYGTIDVHEQLEEKLAKFMGVSDAILYTDTEATMSSVIPAFAKRGDLIVVDDGCRHSIMTGVNLARSTVLFYQHNDLTELENVLTAIHESDKRKKRRSDCQRRYIITEAIFLESGDLLNLPAVLALCEKYYFRLILDESNSFLVLGKNGKGITEHYDVDVSRVEVICASLGCAASSVGGFSIGSQEVVDYQRLNSAGFVYSASAPPFCSSSCMEILDIVQTKPDILQKLQANASYLNQRLQTVADLTVLSSPLSPIAHVHIKGKKFEDASTAGEAYYEVVQRLLREKHIATAVSDFKSRSNGLAKPTLRITVTASHTQSQINELVSSLVSVITK